MRALHFMHYKFFDFVDFDPDIPINAGLIVDKRRKPLHVAFGKYAVQKYDRTSTNCIIQQIDLALKIMIKCVMRIRLSKRICNA